MANASSTMEGAMTVEPLDEAAPSDSLPNSDQPVRSTHVCVAAQRSATTNVPRACEGAAGLGPTEERGAPRQVE